MLQLLHNHCTVYKWATVEEDWKQVQRYEGFYIHPRNTSSSERKANPSPTTPLVNCPLSLLTCCTHFEQVSRISLSVMGEEKIALLGLVSAVSLLWFEWHARAKFPLFNKYVQGRWYAVCKYSSLIGRVVEQYNRTCKSWPTRVGSVRS